MRYYGITLLVAGICFILAGWMINPTVDVHYGGLNSGGVVNIHQLFIKISMIIVGGFLHCSGAIFYVFSPKSSSAAHQPEFRHNNYLVYKTETGKFLVNGKDFPTADEARAWIDAQVTSGS